MEKEETNTGFDPGHEREGAQSVLEAHTRLRDFIKEQIKAVKFPNFGKLGKDGFYELCKIRDDLVFGETPEKMAKAYPTFDEYGQRVIQLLWDTQSYPSGGNGSNERKLNDAGQFLQDFLISKLGINAQPRKKTQDELTNEKLITNIVGEIRRRINNGELAEINSDRIIDEIKRTAPEDRQYEKDLYGWYKRFTFDKKPGDDSKTLMKTVPPEFQADLKFLFHRLETWPESAFYSANEDVYEEIVKRRREWRQEKVVREIVSTSKPQAIVQTTNTQALEEEKENREKILKILASGEFPIIDLKTDEIENFEVLRKTIAQTYAEKYKVPEKDIFVEDAHALSDLKAEVLFYLDLGKAHMMGDPTSLEYEMIPQTEKIRLIRISIKGQLEPKWRVLEAQRNNQWKLSPYKGKIFSDKDKPRLRMLKLEGAAADIYLLKKFPKKEDQDTINTLIKNTLAGDTIHLLESDQGVIARVTTNKNGEAEYSWYELREMIES